MKLRNKKTGEIGVLNISNNKYQVIAYGMPLCGNSVLGEYDTLDALMQEWEDYEDPTGYWYIDFDGDVLGCVEPFDEETEEQRKEIGNYFETKEEAEKAVEKLKAWKRLKDNGFKFKGGDDACISYEFNIEKWNNELEKDFELLFGGKE